MLSQALNSLRCIVVVLMTATVWLLFTPNSYAYETPRNLKEGTVGTVQLGALATFGPTDSSAVTARTTFTFRGEQWEQEFDAKFYRSASEALVSRRDANGNTVLDSQGNEIKDLVKNKTNDRRFASLQIRRFIAGKHYLFGLADVDINEPANIENSSRQIAGVGYKVWHSKNNFVSAAIGYGRKRRVEVSGDTEEGGIAYLGFRLKRPLSENVAVRLDLDSDFGSENRYSEAEVALSWKIRKTISFNIKYEARFNSTVIDPLNDFDRGLEAALSVNLAFDVF